MLEPDDQITKDKLGDLFIEHPVSELMGSGVPPMPVNNIWWGSLEATLNLAKRYNGQPIQAPPYYPQVNHGMVYMPSKMWYLVFQAKAVVNVGELAQEFKRYPEDVAPGVADRNNKATIDYYVSVAK